MSQEHDILELLFETELESVTAPEAAYLLDRRVADVSRELESMVESGALVLEHQDGTEVYRLPEGVEKLPDPSSLRAEQGQSFPNQPTPATVAEGSSRRRTSQETIEAPPATSRDARSRQVVAKQPSRDYESRPGVSALLSFVVPGAGQLNNGEPGKGLAMFVAAMMMWAMLLGWVISVWSVVDAYEGATD